MEENDQSDEQLAVHSLVVGPLDNNVLLLVDASSEKAMVVDPALGATDPIMALARELKVEISLIVNTHSHWDHVADNAFLTEATGAPILIHKDDAAQLTHPTTGVGSLPWEIRPSQASRLIADGDSMRIGSVTFTVIHTPGHTPGSICLYCRASRLLVSGDTLFSGSYGRYDLPGGDLSSLRDSLRRLAELPGDTKVYPGHGRTTTINAEHWLPLSIE